MVEEKKCVPRTRLIGTGAPACAKHGGRACVRTPSSRSVYGSSGVTRVRLCAERDRGGVGGGGSERSGRNSGGRPGKKGVSP